MFINTINDIIHVTAICRNSTIHNLTEASEKLTDPQWTNT